jgi:Tfp pilus assembly protein PilO
MSVKFRVLSDKERRALGRLAVAALIFLALGLVLAVRQRSAFARAEDALAEAQTGRRRAEAALAKARAEGLRWQEAARDLKQFRGSYFYEEETGIQALRQDLSRIFQEAGLRVAQIDYDYGDVAKSRIGRIVANFNFSGSYAALKKFLALIEKFPRFLAVERLDFLNPGTESGVLTVKITLAGYYEI